MDFAEVVQALEHVLRFGINPSLEGIRALTDELGRPQDSFESVQVTGTNGKSSTTRLIAAILAGEGLRSASYTSPHLESYTERIEIAGSPVTEEEFALACVAAFEAAYGMGRYADDFTEFELLTAAALWLMREKDIDVACLEVGMGGRWDATSVVSPRVAVITGVGLDHMERLGDTVEAIAADKAQIIKPGSIAVLGPGTAGVSSIFTERATEVGAPVVRIEEAERPTATDPSLVRYSVRQRPSAPGGVLVVDVDTSWCSYDSLQLHAPGYQAPNVATAVAACEALLGRGLDVHALRTTLAFVSFPGRFELLDARPPLIVDGAHNPQAAAALATAIAEAWPDPAARPWVLLGVLADKDAEGITAALAPVVGGFVATQPVSPRALDAGTLASRVHDVTGVWPEISAAIGPAIPYARAQAGDAGLIITGSLYTAGQARTAMLSAPEPTRGPRNRPKIVVDEA